MAGAADAIAAAACFRGAAEAIRRCADGWTAGKPLSAAPLLLHSRPRLLALDRPGLAARGPPVPGTKWSLLETIEYVRCGPGPRSVGGCVHHADIHRGGSVDERNRSGRWRVKAAGRAAAWWCGLSSASGFVGYDRDPGIIDKVQRTLKVRTIR